MSSLADELQTDLEGLGYEGKTDAEVATILNTANRSRNRSSMTASKVLNVMKGHLGEFDGFLYKHARDIFY